MLNRTLEGRGRGWRKVSWAGAIAAGGLLAAGTFIFLAGRGQDQQAQAQTAAAQIQTAAEIKQQAVDLTIQARNMTQLTTGLRSLGFKNAPPPAAATTQSQQGAPTAEAKQVASEQADALLTGLSEAKASLLRPIIAHEILSHPERFEEP